ncbi:membrane protein [Thiomicrorhabdus immobilis]|uniref:Membrane protein n=1 Tax=Thiomicrorhabdus immobilis TaxID=2791037 RepID=A0ABM7MDH6_9GAMM|nr:DMT family transporter [Thiomicrorhabdus immobilis]BCN93391.1 membrane protein [Thiomicrorhabdus immobilis]
MAVVLAYITVVLIWTTTPLAIVWSGETDWFFGVASRTALGALLILPFYYWFKKDSFRYDFSALRIYFFAAMPIFGGMTLMYWAGQYLPSGWLAIIFAMTPVTTGLFAYFLLPNQSLTVRKIIAIILSLTGLLSIFIPNLDTDLIEFQLMAIIAAILSVSFHSLGSVLVKRCGTSLPSLHVVVGALWFSVLGHLLIAPTTLVHWPELMPREVYAILYAASVGSVIGFLLYFYLVKNVDAMKVALIPVITPVFALLFGHFLNDENLTWTTWFGTGLVILGLILFEWRFKTKVKQVN